MVTLSINTFLTCVNIIYEKSSDSKSRPLVGYIQFAKIIITIIVNTISPTGYPMRMLRQSPGIASGIRPNCEAFGYILDRKVHFQ